ncbi:3D domain-containing protein [Neobacillus niacini]|uniref:3D domain-containing protein n=1 Tax=Neobacillus niacini TaxID=86668 RepID=UPI0025598433|nr:3D domain-containing protein [Neobacillus niacini]
MQHTFKRIVLVVLTIVLCGTGTAVTYAQTNNEALHNANRQLQEKQRLLEEQRDQQQAVNQEIKKIQAELDSLYNSISKNKEEMAKTQAEIDEVNKLIQQKREEIVVLEDKILGRNDIMKKRAVALQQNDNVNLMISIFFESDSIAEFLKRATAASALMDADKDILTAQKTDLQQIEKDKQVIDRQEQVLEEHQQTLASQQAELDNNMQQQQQTLAAAQEKYNQISQQVALAEKEKSAVASQIANIQAAMAAQARPQVASTANDGGGAAISGQELYVSATAYSPEESGSITKLGYNIAANPNMKLIAVDPRVIPLGKKVWVEGYGVAIAGDTGGAIKGHKIDVLMPTYAQAIQWGRKTVKIVVLD